MHKEHTYKKRREKIPALLLVLLCVLVCVFLTSLRCFSILSINQYTTQQGNGHIMQLILKVTFTTSSCQCFCPSCVCVALLSLTGHKTGFPVNVRSRTLTRSQYLFNNNIDTIKISLDDAPCYQHIQRKIKNNKSNCSKIPLCAVKNDPISSIFHLQNVMCA